MINSFKETVLSIDYSWRDPKTYAILIPGLASLIHIIQAKHLEPKLILNEHGTWFASDLVRDPSLINTLDFSNDEKYLKARKFHMLVRSIHIIATILLITIGESLLSNIHCLALGIIALTGYFAFLAEYSLLLGCPGVALSRIKNEGLPTQVQFKTIFGAIDQPFDLTDYLIAETYKNPFPATNVRLNIIGRLSVT